MQMDEGVPTNNVTLINFIQDYRNEYGKAGEAIRSLWLRMEALSSAVGPVPVRLAFDYLAPSSWASIGAIASKLDEVRANQNSYGSRLDNFKSEIGSSVDDKVKLSQEDFYWRLSDFKAAFINASRGLGGRLDNVELRVLGLSENSGTRNHESNTTNAAQSTSDRASHEEDHQQRAQVTTTVGGRDDAALENLTQRVKTRINAMEGKLHGLLAKNDERAIRFFGLGFQSIADSNA
jgi:hypothetical protein